MNLLEDEIRMLSYFRCMGLLPSEVVPFMSRAGKDCNYCPIHEECVKIFNHTRQGGAECQDILKCWIEGTPFNLPVPNNIDKTLKAIGFKRENGEGSKCKYWQVIDGCHVFLNPYISEWDIRLSGGAFEPEVKCQGYDLNDLMLILEKKIRRLIENTKEFVEKEESGASFENTMTMLNFARKAKSAFEVLKTSFKQTGLME